jgi:sporulation protein YqfC
MPNKRPHTKNTKNQKVSLAEKISRGLDIPPDILPGGSLVTIRGRTALSLSGSSSIILYTPEEIRLSMKKGLLSVKGNALVCISYNATEISIEGHINSVSFEEDGDVG